MAEERENSDATARIRIPNSHFAHTVRTPSPHRRLQGLQSPPNPHRRRSQRAGSDAGAIDGVYQRVKGERRGRSNGGPRYFLAGGIAVMTSFRASHSRSWPACPAHSCQTAPLRICPGGRSHRPTRTSTPKSCGPSSARDESASHQQKHRGLFLVRLRPCHADPCETGWQVGVWHCQD